MATATKTRERKTTWEKSIHDYLGAEVFHTGFPSLYGTSIAISTFQPKKLLTLGEALQTPLIHTTSPRAESYFAYLDNDNWEKVYALPNSEADTKLFLDCCFEGDSCSWEANQAFFRKGKLVAMVSRFSEEERDKPSVILDARKSLVEIYQDEIRTLASDLLYHKGEGDAFKEMVDILLARSPEGKGLHNSYRTAVKEILK